MRKKGFRLKSGNEVPLLEQEKIKEFDLLNIKSRKSSITVLTKAVMTIFSTFLVIGFILFVFLINDFDDENSLGQDTTDKLDTQSVIDTSSEMTTATDLDVVAPAETDGEDSEKLPSSNITLDELYKFDNSQVLPDEVGIIPMDLSQTQNGVLYINNSTGYVPNLEALIEKSFKNDNYDLLSNKDAPRVLIIHTHATDSYVYNGTNSYKFNPNRDFARNDEASENVISIGSIISGILNKSGIKTIHCTTLHDSIRYKDSYARSEATIKEYLERYPSIRLIIDIHRDSLLTSGGDIIRPVTLVNNKPTAQVVCVVGSDWAGDRCDNWQDNLSLALKLREQLNLKYSNLCRPVELAPYTFNQEYSKYSMTIKVGSSGNSLQEAQTSAHIVAETLIEILKIIPF